MGEIFAGRYELVDPIGRGGVGAVWRVWDHRRRRYVAAKVLQQRDAHTLLRFVREQALRIDHPYVLAPASWAADDDKVLFTMDLVGGGSFAHLIGDYGPLPPRYVCTLLDQLLSGLAAVHAEGVVHRDIKPANILLEATGTGRPHVRLSDFGIALTKGEPRLTEANFVMGTPGYFAPEQMMGEEPDFPADLFAVGLVALYLLSGHKPDADALIKLFEQGVPNAPAGVPEPLWQVIANLLQPDPDDRFRTATGARKALLTAAEMLPEPGIDDEVIEVFDHLGPLPAEFGPEGPFRTNRRVDADTAANTDTHTDTAGVHSGPTPQPSGPQGPTTTQPPSLSQPSESSASQPSVSQPSMSDTGSFPLPPPQPQTPHTGVPPHLAPPPPSAPQPQAPEPHTGQPHTGQIPSGQNPSGQPHAPYPPHAPHTPYSGLPQPQTPQPAPAQPTPPPRPVRPAQPPQNPLDPRQPGRRPGPPPSHTPTPTPTPATAPAPAAQHEYPRTRPYTAPQPQVPPTARRRPGPSRKTAIAILIAAAVCFAVGTWALLAAG
ncbi:serine/threonine-protein kinase [Streptomyces sp. ME19-01-6]|uniref:serine/threonine-protein kinase n=1 Tax=Streptomyces sp. ME19-01-6 TaxID=3028686 RepID=UPI0029A8DC98|nr:serine/threonine-protein kinase [Streptomyces sp. ME19-01-6]MDX3226956.1 serine/threonine-protein kinase [Streptomyces sp. ME19-01-6]